MILMLSSTFRFDSRGLCYMCRKTHRFEKIPAIELNISCPNVKEGGMALERRPLRLPE